MYVSVLQRVAVYVSVSLSSRYMPECRSVLHRVAVCVSVSVSRRCLSRDFFKSCIFMYVYTYICIICAFLSCFALLCEGLSHAYVHTYIHIYVYTYMYIYVYIYVYIRLYIHTSTHIYVCMYIYIYTCIYIHMYICIHDYMYTYMNRHTRTHSHTHTHTKFSCIRCFHMTFQWTILPHINSPKLKTYIPRYKFTSDQRFHLNLYCEYREI